MLPEKKSCFVPNVCELVVFVRKLLVAIFVHTSAISKRSLKKPNTNCFFFVCFASKTTFKCYLTTEKKMVEPAIDTFKNNHLTKYDTICK